MASAGFGVSPDLVPAAGTPPGLQVPENPVVQMQPSEGQPAAAAASSYPAEAAGDSLLPRSQPLLSVGPRDAHMGPPAATATSCQLPLLTGDKTAEAQAAPISAADGGPALQQQQQLACMQAILLSSRNASISNPAATSTPATPSSLQGFVSSTGAMDSGSSSSAQAEASTPRDLALGVRAYHWSPEKRARSVFFARVPPSVSEEEVALVFSSAGAVEEVQLYRSFMKCRVSKGCGVVRYETAAAAEKAIQTLDGSKAWPTARHPLFVTPVRTADQLPRAEAAGKPAIKQAKASRTAAAAFGAAGTSGAQDGALSDLLQQLALSGGGSSLIPADASRSRDVRPQQLPGSYQVHMPYQLAPAWVHAGGVQQQQLTGMNPAGPGAVAGPLSAPFSSPQVVWGFGGMPAGGTGHVQQIAPGGAGGGAAMGHPGQVAVLVAAPQLGGGQLPQQQPQQPMLTVMQGPGDCLVLQSDGGMMLQPGGGGAMPQQLQHGQHLAPMRAPVAAAGGLLGSTTPVATSTGSVVVLTGGGSAQAQLAAPGVHYLPAGHHVGEQGPGLMAGLPFQQQLSAAAPPQSVIPGSSSSYGQHGLLQQVARPGHLAYGSGNHHLMPGSQLLPVNRAGPAPPAAVDAAVSAAFLAAVSSLPAQAAAPSQVATLAAVTQGAIGVQLPAGLQAMPPGVMQQWGPVLQQGGMHGGMIPGWQSAQARDAVLVATLGM